MDLLRLLLSCLLLLITATSNPPSAAIAAPAPAPSPSPSSSVLYLDSSSSTPLSLHCNKSEYIPGVITTTFLSNPQAIFGCQVSPDRSGYYIVVAITAFSGTPVWAANRQRPIKENATLVLDRSNSTFSLFDSPSSSSVSASPPLWQIHHPNLSSAAGLSLLPNGNLIIFDASNSPLWQSFDQPLDLIVPEQSLTPGSTLVAGFSSHLTPTANFYASMEPGGLVLYENSTSRPLPYYAFAYPWTSTTLDAVARSPCNHTHLTLNSLNMTQAQDPPVCLAALEPNATATVIVFEATVAFVRLEPTGKLIAYYEDHRPSYDILLKQSRGTCAVPNICEGYGICYGPGDCRCPVGGHFNSTAQCSLVIPLDCLSTPSFLELQGIDYFANDHISPTSLTDTFALCQQSCASSCSCKAAFYRNATKQCFLHEAVMSMIATANTTYMAAVKVQDVAGAAAERKKGNSEVKLIVGITVGAAASVVLLAAWFYVKEKRGGSWNVFRNISKEEDELLLSLPGQPRRFTFKELQAATWEFSQKLGGGGFGSVYKGVFPDGSSVAVKQLESATTASLKEFRNEVNTLSNINHQNLVHLRGFCAEGMHRLLVYEFVPNGSLDSWLFTKGAARPGPPLDWRQRLSIATQTAQGLYFLHEQCRNSIIHLDIKPQNILLDKGFVPKISDFGLSRLVNEDNNTAFTRMRGTPGYMAPECLIITDASEKSDVYSFGMVLLEIVSGRKNVDLTRLVLHGDEERWYFPAYAAQKLKVEELSEIVDEEVRKGATATEMAEVKRVLQVAFWCIQDQPAMRPSMHKVLLMLQGHSQVRTPPLSFSFGMRFHLNSAMPSAPTTPKHPSSPPPPRRTPSASTTSSPPRQTPSPLPKLPSPVSSPRLPSPRLSQPTSPSSLQASSPRGASPSPSHSHSQSQPSPANHISTTSPPSPKSSGGSSRTATANGGQRSPPPSHTSPLHMVD